MVVKWLVLVFAITLVATAAQDDTEDTLSQEEYLKEMIGNYLDKTGDQLTAVIPNRDKKSRPTDQEPLSQHSRKNFFAADSSTCQASNMLPESNVMVDSKMSISNGAVFLHVEKIGMGSLAKSSLKELHMSCARVCCENEDGCDTALLSLKLGEVFYS